MRGLAAVLLPCAMLAQETPPRGLVRGSMLEWDGTAEAGEVTFRLDDHRVYRCSFDRRSYFERESAQVPVGRIDKADRVEMVWDQVGTPSRCYVRTARVLSVPVTPVNPFRTRRPPYRLVTESIVPRGNMTFAGVVRQVLPDGVVLRTRVDGDKTIRLRQDTRYIEAGSAVEAAALQVNMRVFVRAGKNLENEIEAYQVMWGEILPRP